MGEPIKMPEYEPESLPAGGLAHHLRGWIDGETLTSKFIIILETICSIRGERGESSGVS